MPIIVVECYVSGQMGFAEMKQFQGIGIIQFYRLFIGIRIGGLGFENNCFIYFFKHFH